jgi:hypothetical protein
MRLLLLLFMFRFNVKAVLSLSLTTRDGPQRATPTFGRAKHSGRHARTGMHGSRDSNGVHIYVGAGRQAYPQTTSWLHVWTACIWLARHP